MAIATNVGVPVDVVDADGPVADAMVRFVSLAGV
jgi:hypothetical protein